MPSSYSASLRFELQFTGENTNVWGEKLNSTLSKVDFSIAGRTTVTMTGGTYILSSSNSDDEARAAVISCAGSGGTLRIPALTKVYRIENTGSAGVIVTTGSGTTITVDPTDTLDVHCDGTNVKTPGVNGLTWKQYIASVAIGTISGLPATAENNGKVMYVQSGSAIWKTLVTTDISDYGADQTSRDNASKALAIAFAAAL